MPTRRLRTRRKETALQQSLFREPCEVAKREADEFVAFYESLSSIKAASSLDRRAQAAIDRMALSYERRLVEDRLVDHWIALEGLFVEDSGGELVRRASLRIARLLEDDPAGRRELATWLRKKSYAERSKIVHGGSVNVKALRGLADETEDVLRRCLRKIIDGGGVVDLDAIDFG